MSEARRKQQKQADKKASRGAMIVYVVSLLVFVALAAFYNQFERVTTSPIADTDNANTQFVLETIEADPLSGQGRLCEGDAENAVRTQEGWPFTLYESVSEQPCGRASGIGHPTRRNQILNTALAAVLAGSIGGARYQLMRKS